MTDFQVGDRVKGKATGRTGTVKYVHDDGYIDAIRDSGTGWSPHLNPNRFELVSRPEKENFVKLLKSKVDGSIVELIAEDGDEVWVRRRSGVTKWTSKKECWEEYDPEPEVGDIWQHSPDMIEYVCVGIDRVNNRWLMVGKTDLGGNKDLFRGSNSIEYATKHTGYIWSRKLPEKTMTLKERRS